MRLAEHGLSILSRRVQNFLPLNDRDYLRTGEGITKSEVAKFSARDAAAFPKYEAYLESLAVVVESLLLVTPPELPPKSPGDFIEYLKLLARFRKLGRREITGLIKIFTQSAADLLDEWFESPEIKVTLATDGVIGANGGPRSAGTAYILMHHCMGGVAGKRGLWGFVKGGMGAVSEAIAALVAPGAR